ncbi:MAG TPA: nitronate monooxygenase [Caulobacteraceae bacterium]|nr:nitronate monooxygenase [Caulobacteraceae bacterium]
MDLHTPVCDLLCCETPIVLAGMGGVARSELVAAVTQAGGFGFLGMVRETPELIRAEIDAVRARTTRPFGVNLIPAATRRDLLAAELAVCIEAKVHAVTLFWDLDRAAAAALRDAGILVVCQVGSVEEANAAEEAGADILIVQGVEAGGHVRGRMGLLALLEQVLAAAHVPILAAGGITDGADLAAVLKAGAQGALVGTAFLATEESFAHDYHKQRVIDAAAGATLLTEAFHINWPAGAAVRVLPNSVTRGERGDPATAARQVIGVDDGRPILLFSTDSPLRSTTGDLEAMAIYAGQGAGRLLAILPAAERLYEIAADANARLRADRSTPACGPLETAEPASETCYAARADDGYMGFIPAAELAAELNVLLEAERAGARVAARLVADCRDAELKTLSTVIHADEVRWCRVLFEALVDLGAAPSQSVGSFYEKAMAIEHVEARLAFVNRGQGWVVRKLRDLLPRIRDDRLHASLRQMLEAHELNIASANDALARRGAPSRP